MVGSNVVIFSTKIMEHGRNNKNEKRLKIIKGRADWTSQQLDLHSCGRFLLSHQQHMQSSHFQNITMVML